MLHKPAVERIKTVTLEGPDMLGIFEELAKAASAVGSDCTECSMSYIGPDDDFEPGTYVPEITFMLRKVLDDTTD